MGRAPLLHEEPMLSEGGVLMEVTGAVGERMISELLVSMLFKIINVIQK